MGPHPIPRQITTFEFKLIGFMTLKEFGYMIVFAGLATVAYFLTPGETFKYISAALVFAIGIFLAFYKYNERSVDVWIRNLILKLFSSSQYYYHKKNEPPSFLQDIIYDKKIAVLHADAQKKLTSYLGKAGKSEEAKVNIEQKAPERVTEAISVAPATPEVAREAPIAPEPVKTVVIPEQPALSGIVKNGKDLPIPNILVYVKNKDGQVARILRTDNRGIFSTTKPLGDDQVTLEPKDSANRFFFDTLNVNPGATSSLVIRSREAL
ncbi:MAG: PrgI family protein [Microgenomates group bacterium]